jgi:hypothetical protein
MHQSRIKIYPACLDLIGHLQVYELVSEGNCYCSGFFFNVALCCSHALRHTYDMHICNKEKRSEHHPKLHVDGKSDTESQVNTYLTKYFRTVLYMYLHDRGARGSVVVKAPCYKPEGRWVDSRWGEFLNLPNLSGSTRPCGLLSL